MNSAEKAYENLHNTISSASFDNEQERMDLLHDLNALGSAAFRTTLFTADTVRSTYQDKYGHTIDDRIAMRIARNATTACRKDEVLSSKMQQHLNKAIAEEHSKQ